MTNFQQRLASTLEAIPILSICLYAAKAPPWQPLFLIAVLAIALTATWELLQLIAQAGMTPLKTLTLAGSTAYLVALFLTSLFAPQQPLWYMAPPLVLLLLAMLLFACELCRGSHPTQTIAATVLSFVYITIPLGTALSITYLPPPADDGRWWLLFLVVVTKGNDVAAYVVGRSWGRRPLAPYVSPKKTYEGAAAGLAAAAALGALFAVVSPLPLTPGYATLLALLLAAVAQLGDLTESLLKRDAGIKNSSSLPGLGGILDIVDSLVFSTPLLYILLKIYYGLGSSL